MAGASTDCIIGGEKMILSIVTYPSDPALLKIVNVAEMREYFARNPFEEYDVELLCV